MNWQELVEKCDIYTYISQFVDLEYKTREDILGDDLNAKVDE